MKKQPVFKVSKSKLRTIIEKPEFLQIQQKSSTTKEVSKNNWILSFKENLNSLGESKTFKRKIKGPTFAHCDGKSSILRIKNKHKKKFYVKNTLILSPRLDSRVV